MSIARHHTEWLSLIEQSGPFVSLPVLQRVFPQGLDARDSEHRQELRLAYEEWTGELERRRPDPAIHTAWLRFVLTQTLGFPDRVIAEGPALHPSLNVVFGEHGETLRPTLAIVTPEDEPDAGKARLLVQLYPPDQHLDKTVTGKQWKASPATRMAELLRGANVRLGLVTNGEQWMLVDAPRGETTGFTSWYARLWLDEPLTLRAFRSLLGVHRFFGVPDSETIEALLAESATDQAEVTDQLGRQVRRAIEILVQAVDRADKDRDRALLAGVSEEELYEAAVTVMMRLVFLFYAEENELLLLGDPLYDQYYAVSTLRQQLRETADHAGEETLERRHDAWNRLLATFRAVHGGISHDRLRLIAYGGTLFEPDRFPFLEGRAPGTTWREDSAEPLPVNNRTVLHLLDALQVLQLKAAGRNSTEARRLSFRALDVEQIGHVYESLLDHTAKRANEPILGLNGSKDKEPEVALTALEREHARGEDALVGLLKDETGRSPIALGRGLSWQPDMIEEQHFRQACDNDAALWERVRPFAGLVRSDSSGRPVVINTGSVYVTSGTDRRTTGAHYTPRSLTEPIVQHALEPLVYDGPAEGKPKQEWRLRSPGALLDLKVCDMAMGSGAFLVQTCRYLSERLVEAWEEIEQREGAQVRITPEGKLGTGASNERVLPKDADERLAIARRIVADHCLYGVDKNHLAVEMAKLSLWLITLQKDRPFTFLDHKLRCGDSLLGIASLEQLTYWSLGKDSDKAYPMFVAPTEKAIKRALRLRERIEATPVLDARDAEEKARLQCEAEDAMALVRLGADLLVAAALDPEPRRREPLRERFLAEFQVALAADEEMLSLTELGKQPAREALAELRADAENLLGVNRPFHWPLEFPEIFIALAEQGEPPGFSAVVGNPPFMGGKKISGALGTATRDLLVSAIGGCRKGHADLVAYFILRGADLIRVGGELGLLATNTVAQGDTREVGLDHLVTQDIETIRAVPSRKWPGAASLEVAHLWMHKGHWSGDFFIDDMPVSGISPFLTESGATSGLPKRLAANGDRSFIGSFILGMGFVLSVEEATEIVSKDARNRDVLYPFLSGDDLNSQPNRQPTRWVVNFHDWSDTRASTYRDCWQIIEERVKPERQRQKPDGSYALRKPLPQRYWQYADKRPALYRSLAALSRAIVVTMHAKHLMFEFFTTDVVFGHALAVVASDDASVLATLSSDIHTAWAFAYGSSLGHALRYTPSDCFETFPFPTHNEILRELGNQLTGLRRELSRVHDIGLTELYNRFHDPNWQQAEVTQMRDLQVSINLAVAAAYEWDDLDLGHGFHETKQGVRFTISESARREVLDRLLRLNHERYDEEVAQGLHDKGAKGRKKGTSSGRRKRAAGSVQPALNGFEGGDDA
jgi:hypothetical protein